MKTIKYKNNVVVCHKFKLERELNKITQSDLGAKCGTDDRTIRRLENCEGEVSERLIDNVANVLGKPVQYFFLDASIESRVDDDAMASQVCDTLEIATYVGMRKAEQVLNQPHMFGFPKTDPKKVNPDDFTTKLDSECGKGEENALFEAANNPGNVLSDGFWLIREEKPMTCIPGKFGTYQKGFVLTEDEVDDTATLLTWLGGTILHGCYRIGHGWVAATVGDFARRRIYYRISATNPLAQTTGAYVPEWPEEWSTTEKPKGRTLRPAPRATKSLKGASIVMYLGKPYRITDVGRATGQLLAKETGIKSVHSHGGSLGPIMVADGSVDVSLEVMRGFKRIDLMPGLFIAKGAGATVLRIHHDGSVSHFDFGVDKYLEDIIASETGTSELVEDLRERFVVAATENLAMEVIEKINLKS